jgi:hypothetical protein
MIIDRVRLAGLDAYLRDQGVVNLAVSNNHRGQSTSVKEGVGIDVSGISLLLEANDLLKLYPRSAAPHDKPLLAITVKKEMFPEFFADPYAHRVHTIAGFEDFQRGILSAMRPMEVEGQATLVSLGSGSCGWVSPAYRLHGPIQIAAAAWDLATSRLTPPDSFTYTLSLVYWTVGQDPETDTPSAALLAPASGPGAVARPGYLRHRADIQLKDVISYRIAFKANVNYDAFLTEMQFGPDVGRSLGRPLLRAVHVLEPIESIYKIYCLHELESRCSEFTLLDVAQPLRTLSAYIDLPAMLIENEEIAIQVAPELFERCEARLDAEIRIRPPLIDKAIGA